MNDTTQATPERSTLNASSKPFRSAVQPFSWAACAFAALLCAAPMESAGASLKVNDPLQSVNRKVHKFNRAMDKFVIVPASKAYGAVVPDGIENAITRFADNLSIPKYVLNRALQAEPRKAGANTLRFAVNSTIGILGFFDPATSMGIPAAKRTDFGETLYVWGVGEGIYLELPVFGPATGRSAVGQVVGALTNPVSFILNDRERTLQAGVSAGSLLTWRRKASRLLDPLYGSRDSYRAVQSAYLQNRRHSLDRGRKAGYGAKKESTTFSDTLDDPFEEFFDEAPSN